MWGLFNNIITFFVFIVASDVISVTKNTTNGFGTYTFSNPENQNVHAVFFPK